VTVFPDVVFHECGGCIVDQEGVMPYYLVYNFLTFPFSRFSYLTAASRSLVGSLDFGLPAMFGFGVDPTILPSESVEAMPIELLVGSIFAPNFGLIGMQYSKRSNY